MGILRYQSIDSGNVLGSNYLWHVSDDGKFEATLFVRERVKETTTDHTIFIRCRSFQSSLQHGGAGYAIAFTEDGMNTWKLGMVAYSHPELLSKLKVLVYEWKGHVVPGIAEDSKKAAVPKYCFASTSNSLKEHFLLRCIDIRGKHDIVFLNQVSGPRVGIFALSPGLTNLRDGGYQSSPASPDWLLPGFRWTITSETRETILGFACPAAVPKSSLNSFKTTAPSKRRCRRGWKSNVTGRTVHSTVAIDRVEQPVYFVRDGPDRLQGRTVTIDGKRILTTSTSLVAVPYVAVGAGEEIDSNHVLFGLVAIKEFKSWVRNRQKTTVTEHNNYLDTNAFARLSCVLIDTNLHPNGFRVCVCPFITELVAVTRHQNGVDVISSRPAFSSHNREESDCCPLIFRNNAPVLAITKFEGGNQDLPGESVCVSHVFPLPIPPAQKTDVRMADLLIYTYGIGYQNRQVAECIGQNVYFGGRDSSRPRPTLLEGPGDAAKYPYGRANFCDIGMPVGESKVRGLGTFVKQFGLWNDPTIQNGLKLLRNDGCLVNQRVCRVAILTQGIPNVCFSFANASHVDKRDTCSGTLTKLNQLIQKGLDEGNDEAKHGARYLQRWVALTGESLCVPTTCGYEFVGSFVPADPDNVTILHYFVLDGLGIAYRLKSEIGHLFYASTFSHQTSVCIAVAGNDVYYHGNEGRVFAWGEAGS